LVITYRNDEGTPHSPDGFYRFGATEWKDLEAAVQYAVDHGAEDIVLVGYSMGGGIATKFLEESSLAREVVAAIFDAPLLKFEATIDYAAQRRGYPPPLVFLGKTLAAWRFDIDWQAQDYLRRAGELAVPILLFHGDDDTRAPLWVSEALAAARPGLVTYVMVPGATHVRSWNMDPEAYARHVRGFLSAVVSEDVRR
jgi:alpha-beta hydrolase superfamily lysophospholipase